MTKERAYEVWNNCKESGACSFCPEFDKSDCDIICYATGNLPCNYSYCSLEESLTQRGIIDDN